jgi:[ribosomal protein S18]-alanine N-acetyltransferase
MAISFSVDRATPLDAELMAAIHASCFAAPWDEAAMARFIVEPGTLCLIGSVSANAACAPAGLLIARKAADEAEILTFGVTPERRRIGLGRALLETAAAALRESGAKQLFIEVEEGNDAAVRLYRAAGAIPVGKRARYYAHGADAAIFSLAL